MRAADITQVLINYMNNRKSSKNKKKELQKKLIAAAYEGNIELIKDCIKDGADVSANADDNYDTSNNDALSIAIKNNQDKAVIFLMSQVLYGIYSVALAIEYRNYRLAKTLLIGIALSIQKIPDECLQQLILKHIDGIDDPSCISIRNIISIERKLIREKIVDLIVNGNNTLTSQDEELIKQAPYLLHECTLNYCIDITNTPLLAAVLRDNNIIARRLIELDSEKKSLNIASNCYMANNPPLVLALKRGNYEVAKSLIIAGANVNGKGFRGFTPLHWACILRFNDIIELLLMHGADPQIKNAFGRQPLDYYLSDISADDLSFSRTFAQRPDSAEDYIEEISYDRKDVTFVTLPDATYHKEPARDYFATKVPDYSDLYWHIEGILNNLGLHNLLVTNPGMSDAEKFNLYTSIFAEIRCQCTIRKELIEIMRKTSNKQIVVPISLFNNTLDTKQPNSDNNIIIRQPTPPL